MNTTEPQVASIDLVSAALVQCQGDLKAAEFDATNPFFKSKYATLGSVIEASRQALLKNGLAVLQVPSINGDLVTLKTTLIHKSGQMLDCGSMSLGLGESDRNSDAQLAGSLITYLRRYSWSSVLGIYADTDTDGNDAPKKLPGATPGRSVAPEVSTEPQSPPTAPKAYPAASPVRRDYVIKALKATPGEVNRTMLFDYLLVRGWIKPDQQVEDWDLREVPLNAEQIQQLIAAMDKFRGEQR